jgi:carboxyl-terminal processing protease
VQIDGQPAAGLGLPDVVKRIAGAQGTTVRLKIRRDGQESDLEIVRGPVKLPTVKGFRRGADGQWEYLLSKDPHIGYLQVAQFGSQTPQELRDAWETLRRLNAAGLILDLRFCPGGTLESAVETARLFVAGGTIVSVHSRQGEPVTMKANETAPISDVPLVVLVNGQTASAAEVVAGALQDNRRAVVLGTRTLGKASVQTIIKLDGGSGAIKLTTAQYRLPGGRNIDRLPNAKSWGIDPDDGYFVPLGSSEADQLLALRRQRDILGGQEAAREPLPAAAKASDPQLAAALVAVTGRLETGAFAKVNPLTAQQVEQFLKRQEIGERRASLLQTLQQLDRDLAEIEKGAPR